MQFRLATYNIHKGIGGVDRRYRPQRIIETLAKYRPDIVMLQEVDDGVPRSRGHQQVELLADALGMRYRVFQPNVKLTKGVYGNAVLSRLPISEVRNIELTIPLKKRRRAQFVRCRYRVEGHIHRLVVVNTHLGLAGFERKIQLRKLIHAEVFVHTHHETPLIIAGDFNDVYGKLGRRMLQDAGFRCAVGRTKTFPAILPLRPLDRIYYRGRLELVHSFASRSKLARQASDHLPLIVDMRTT